jgi:hypothetical protein
LTLRKLLTICVAIAGLALCPGRAAAQVTDEQFDNWIKEVNLLIKLDQNDPHGGKRTELKVCVGSTLMDVTIDPHYGFAVSAISDGNCPPSVDANGNPLPYDGVLRSLPTLGLPLEPETSFPAALLRPKAAPASERVPELPYFRDIPLQPFYAAASLPQPPPCDPSKKAQVLLVNHGKNSVTRYNSCSGAVIAVINVASLPLQCAVTPDGSTAIVTSFDNAVNFIDLSTNTVSFTLKTTLDINPDGIAISPDGTLAYITSFNNENSSVQAINIAQHALVGSVALNPYAQSVFITPDGSQLWVTFPFSNEVDIIDTLTLNRFRGFILQNPFGVAFDATGSRAFITSRVTPGVLTVMDTATYNIITTVAVGGGPVEAVFAPDDAYLAVTGFDSNTVTIVDPRSFQTFTGKLPGPPMGLAIGR